MGTQPPHSDEPVAPTQAELDKADAAAKELSAFFCNRIFIQPDGVHLRMTFGERIGDDSKYHFSIVVPNADAVEFGRLISEMAQAAVERQVEQMRAAFADQDSSGGAA